MTLVLTIAGFYVVIVLRAGGTYLLGRLAARSGRTSVRARIGEQRIARAEAVIDRWGPLAVLGSFLTVGVQTAVNFTAGLLRMRTVAYLPALAVGGLVWASVYGSLGALSIAGTLAMARRYPLPAVALVLLFAAAAVVFVVRGFRAVRGATPDDVPADAVPSPADAGPDHRRDLPR